MNSLCAFVLAVIMAFEIHAAASAIPEIGGSNYGIITAGEFIQKQTEESWYSAKGIKSSVGHFHQYSALALAQLQKLARSGQKKIALPIWTIESRSQTQEEYGHAIKIGDDHKIRAQHARNLVQILNEVKRLRFNTVYLRFNHQGGCDPSYWNAWNEEQYQENFIFLTSVREIAESTLRNSGVTVIYDLGGELGGRGGITSQYTKIFWQQWVKKFGASRTVGFSLAWAPGRLKQLLQDLSAAGVFPDAYALDIYDNELSAAKQALRELTWAKQSSHPVVIMESYFNDARAAEDFLKARMTYGLNITTIMQWPLARNSGKKHFSRDLADDYLNYQRVSAP